MSKVMNTVRFNRRQLLTSVSAIALLGSVCAAGDALAAEDGNSQPQLWIELGPQFEQVSGRGDIFAPPFVGATDWKSEKLISPAATQNMNPYSFGGEGNISFQPEGSDWVFSAGIRYGRTHGKRNVHDQPQPPKNPYYLCPNHCLGKGGYATPTATNYENTSATSSEAHTLLDFQAGKDLGLGMFGKKGTSVLSAGVRIAQFNSSALINHGGAVDSELYNLLPSLPPPKYAPLVTRHHAYALYGHSERNFRGVGPSISWKASAPIVGTANDSGITLDWGVNAAVLFGRQKAKVTHQTTGQYYIPKYHNGFPQGLNMLYQHPAVPHSRERSVAVPNLGGMAGISFRYADAKISFGYRGDFFFGAIDGGIDTRKSTTRGFYGPFVSMSVGVGD